MSNEWVDSNWNSVDRIGSALAGGALIALGIRWQSPARIGALAAGGILLYWGMTGDSRLCRLLGYEGSHTRSGVASVHHHRAIRIEKAIAVDGPVETIYRIWRNPENLPCFINQLKSVRAIPGNRSHWIAKGPGGRDFEWESEIYSEKENESFAWRSMLNADVNNAGSIHFRNLPDSSQTEVRVIVSYEPPGGRLGAWAARITGADPEMQIEQSLVQFKQEFESGNLSA